MADAPATGAEGDFDISAIMKSFSRVTGAIDSSIADLNATEEERKNIGVASDSAINTAANAQATVNTIDNATALKTQAANSRAAADFGVNPNAANFVLAALGHKMLEEKTDLDERDKKIQSKMDTGFFDDPLSWLSNQLTLPMEVAAYNNKLKGFQQDSETISMLTRNAGEAMTINNAIAEKESTERLAAVNSQLFAKAALDVQTSHAQLLKLGIEGINVRTKLSEDQFQLMLGLNSALNSKMDLELKKQQGIFAQRRLELAEAADVRAQHAETRADRELAIREAADLRAEASLELQREAGTRDERRVTLQEEFRNWQLSDKKEKAEDEHAWQQRLDAVMDATGNNRVSLKQFERMSGTMKDAMQRLMLSPDIENGRVGNSTSSILNNYNAINAPLTPGMNIVREKLIKIQNTEIQRQQLTGVDLGKKSPAEQEAILSPMMKEAWQREQMNIPDNGGIFSAPPLLATLTIPKVAELAIAKDLAPMAGNNPEFATSANTVYNVALQKVLRGEMQPGDAAKEVATLFQAVNLDNTSQRQYRRFAIAAPTTYNTSLNVNAGWGGSRVVDMTNAAQLESYITREMIFLNSTGNRTAAGPGNLPNGVSVSKGKNKPTLFGIPETEGE